MASAQPNKLRVSLIQVKGRETKEKILANVSAYIREAVEADHPRIVALPECVNGPYTERLFKDFAEVVPTGPTSQLLSNLAKELNIYVLAGIIERDDNDPSVLYNACTVWGPDGSLVARHRKTHLCDVELEDVVIKEIDYLKPGNGITTFVVDGVKCGVAICFDASFSGFIHLYKQAGCDIIFFPAAYNIQTGDALWDVIFRARAHDNQVFTVAISPARDHKAEYVSWGHSYVADPYGQIVAQAGILEEILTVDLDLNLLTKYRAELPIFRDRRTDIYEITNKKGDSNDNA